MTFGAARPTNWNAFSRTIASLKPTEGPFWEKSASANAGDTKCILPNPRRQIMETRKEVVFGKKKTLAGINAFRLERLLKK